MALFGRRDEPQDEVVSGSDTATRALSAAVVETDFVEHVYEKIASVYDYTFGPTLHTGRIQALQRMAVRPGDRILEVGVGTGINLPLYPRDCQVTGVDLAPSMLDRARARVARRGLRNVRLLQMDAQDLKFPDGAFDIVYAPYVISVVPDPVRVTFEMRRVCRRGGLVIVLNHFRSANRIIGRIERAISPLTVHIGFKSDLDLPAFLAQANLQPVSIEKVNLPPMWSLVTCIAD
jgi:phosphatidylethanolamine/phosphatidyl-N-methylethanolamine N-methyltransferase